MEKDSLIYYLDGKFKMVDSKFDEYNTQLKTHVSRQDELEDYVLSNNSLSLAQTAQGFIVLSGILMTLALFSAGWYGHRIHEYFKDIWKKTN